MAQTLGEEFTGRLSEGGEGRAAGRVPPSFPSFPMRDPRPGSSLRAPLPPSPRRAAPSRRRPPPAPRAARTLLFSLLVSRTACAHRPYPHFARPHHPCPYFTRTARTHRRRPVRSRAGAAAPRCPNARCALGGAGGVSAHAPGSPRAAVRRGEAEGDPARPPAPRCSLSPCPCSELARGSGPPQGGHRSPPRGTVILSATPRPGAPRGSSPGLSNPR